jgi:hypothetical protein
MDAKTPSVGRNMMDMDQGFCTEEEKDVPSEALRQD